MTLSNASSQVWVFCLASYNVQIISLILLHLVNYKNPPIIRVSVLTILPTIKLRKNYRRSDEHGVEFIYRRSDDH